MESKCRARRARRQPAADAGVAARRAPTSAPAGPAFFALLREWYARNRHGNVTTADFTQLAEGISGQPLDAFFDVWLYQRGKPASW